MAAKQTLLTQADFDAISKFSEWRIVELDLAAVRDTPGIQRKHDMIGVFASGDFNATKTLNNQEAVFGMDVLAYEHRPKAERGEGHLNVYHYVITRRGCLDRPYCLHGPYTKETLIGHWPQCLDLGPYN
jgi:hypothetical protein